MNSRNPLIHVLALVLATVFASAAAAAETEPKSTWKVGAPIVTYYAGPSMSEAVAAQMAQGGFNVVWCGENDLDLLQKHNLRGMLHNDLLTPATLDDPARVAQLDALIERIRNHPAFYAYYLVDEPSAKDFAAWGRLVAHLRRRDPARLAYINLFPLYSTNEQLGNAGDTLTAYREHLKQFIETAKPAMLSYDHYQFLKGYDSQLYFLNLAMVREASQAAGVPFLNIVQASSWMPDVRVPTGDEVRYLSSTTLAYGACGISYYVYTAANHEGGIADAAGNPTALYEPLKSINRDFVAIAGELQPLRSNDVFHTTMKEAGCAALPAGAAFRAELTPAKPDDMRGLLIGWFGPKPETTSHALVVNLNYKEAVDTTIVGPAALELFDGANRQWSPANAATAKVHLEPGGCKLVRVR